MSNDPFSYQISYKLDKAHFAECFNESMQNQITKHQYYKAIVFIIIGMGLLLFTQSSSYISWFIVALGILDALGVYYKKPWWLARQMLSRAANSELTLTIDKEGIRNNSFYVNNMLEWQDITKIKTTSKGLLICHRQGTNYLSNSVLSHQAIEFINLQFKNIGAVEK